jgi:P-loop containing dynein motor region/AAA+ lid domain
MHAHHARTAVQMIASMGPPGGGRNPVTPRLLRHFSTISFAELTDRSISRIFETIIGAHAAKYLAPPAAAAATAIVAATTSLYNSIRTTLLPTPSKSHYTFNLRDIAKVIQVGAPLQMSASRRRCLHGRRYQNWEAGVETRLKNQARCPAPHGAPLPVGRDAS